MSQTNGQEQQQSTEDKRRRYSEIVSAFRSSLLCQKYECDVCSMTFPKPGLVARHKQDVHNIDDPNKRFKCKICSTKFATSKSRRLHEKRIHKCDPSFKQELVCSECQESFHSRRVIKAHISKEHPHVNLFPDRMVLKSREEFNEWKLNVEKETNSFFTSKKLHKTKDYTFHYFCCHRSGSYKSRSKGVRRLKARGSNKSGYFCPAYISMKAYSSSNTVEVTYISHHVGHECEVDRLPRKNIPVDDAGGNDSSADMLGTSEAKEWSDVGSSEEFREISIRTSTHQNFDNDGENLRERAVSALLGVLQDLEDCTNEELLKDVIRTMAALKSRYNALKIKQKEPSPIVSRATASKRIKKQNSKKNLLTNDLRIIAAKK